MSKNDSWLSETRAASGLVPSLDGMRAISIGLVLGQYFIGPFVPGSYGVFVFFVISGFLITRLLYAEESRTGNVSLRDFYIRRLLRLYPVIIVYVAVACTYMAFANVKIDWNEPVSALLYYCNYLVSWKNVHGEHFSGPFSIFWSLSVEEQFYILFPTLFILFRRSLVPLAIAACLAPPLLRASVGFLHPELIDTHFFYTRTEFRFDALAYGVLLAALCQSRPNWIRALGSPLVIGVLAALTLGAILAPPLLQLTLRDVFMGMLVAAGLAGLVFSPRYGFARWALNLPVVAWVGKLSYSLYVWHYLVVTLLKPFSGPAFNLVGLALTVGIAAISYYAVERPALSFRNRFRRVAVDHDASATPGPDRCGTPEINISTPPPS